MAQKTATLNVSMASIINQLHDKYARMITGIMQENAELQAGVEYLSNENDELKAQVAAMTARQEAAEPLPGKGVELGGRLDLSGSGSDPLAQA